MEKLQQTVRSANIGSLLVWGLVVRLLMMAYSILYHDKQFRVKYTDIDYNIITDGAAEMLSGGTPFDRATFRYTPLLALLMAPSLLWHHAGKLVFVACDIGAGYYCYEVLLQFASAASAKTMVSLFILFNPVVVNVSTRGNSDMVISLLSLIVLSKYFNKRYVEAAAWLGFAVHFKIYPLIYAAPLAFGLVYNTVTLNNDRRGGVGRLYAAAIGKIVLCGIVALICFAIPTALCYAVYGYQYLYEALIYHFYREDHRHNLSPYWLLMYLNMGLRSLKKTNPSDVPAFLLGADFSAGIIAFVPQFIALLVVSWKLRRNIAHACCIETIIFVAFNKVCTVQYFVWFLPFLPFVLCEPKGLRRAPRSSEDASLRGYGWLVAAVWLGMIVLWMVVANQLEFQGKNWFGALWVVSCGYFLTQVAAAAYFARAALRQQETTASRHVE
jgi:phosphatidylinositol glycan class M